MCRVRTDKLRSSNVVMLLVVYTLRVIYVYTALIEQIVILL